MQKKDPFDEILMRCLDDGNGRTVDRKSVENIQNINLVQCANCNELIHPNYRYCPNCGDATVDKSGDSSEGFSPLIMQKKTFRVTVSELDRDFSINGEYFTKLRLRIENLTDERLHLSLTFVDSAIINSSGRQFGPVDGEEIDVPDMFESWFYVYPRAFREGIMVFPEITDRIKSVYICCNPQNTDEEELFHFIIEP